MIFLYFLFFQFWVSVEWIFFFPFLVRDLIENFSLFNYEKTENQKYDSLGHIHLICCYSNIYAKKNAFTKTRLVWLKAEIVRQNQNNEQ